MALTVAGLRADGETTVLDTGCIRTSFPGFVETLQQFVPDSVEQEE
jgi:5-enolpyruvylshikimate-3-phosphate synthase